MADTSKDRVQEPLETNDEKVTTTRAVTEATKEQSPVAAKPRAAYYEEAHTISEQAANHLLRQIPELEAVAVVHSYKIPNDQLPAGIALGREGQLRHPAEIMHMGQQLHIVSAGHIQHATELLRTVDGHMQEQSRVLAALQEQINDKKQELADLTDPAEDAKPEDARSAATDGTSATDS